MKKATEIRSGKEFYKMSSQNRGYCILIDNYKYNTLSTRYGNRNLSNKLGQTFLNLNFCVEKCENLTSSEIKQLLSDFASKLELASHDALVLIIISHSNGENMCGVDFKVDGDNICGTINVKEVIEKFSHKNCPLMKGKPKLLILSTGVNVDTKISDDLIQDGLSDMFLVHTALRNSSIDLDFLKIFNIAINEHSWNLEIEEIYQAAEANCFEIDSMKQKPRLEVINRRKQLYLNPGYYIDQNSSNQILALTADFVVKKIKLRRGENGLIGINCNEEKPLGPYIIAKIQEGSPADSSGLEVGDIIFEVNKNWAFCTEEDFTAFLGEKIAGNQVEVVAINFNPKKLIDCTLSNYQKASILLLINERLLEDIQNTGIFTTHNMQLARDILAIAKTECRLYLVRGKDDEKDEKAWHYVLVDEDKIRAFHVNSESGSIDVKDYGSILKSGWGENPSQEIDDEIFDIAVKKQLASENSTSDSVSRHENYLNELKEIFGSSI